jgi:hypothetical protein
MTKKERLQIEEKARAAVGRIFHCTPTKQRVLFPASTTKHEFDIYAQGRIIGGFSTSPRTAGNGSNNTGGCDRASAELLWLSLWPGSEKRIHVLSDTDLASWIVKYYRGVRFPNQITIFHYDCAADSLSRVGVLDL